jgi:hypothetical protein
MCWYRDEAVKIQKMITAARTTKLIRERVESVYLPNMLERESSVGPFQAPCTLAEWHTLKNDSGLPPASPLTAVYLFVVALAIRDTVGTSPLCETFHPVGQHPIPSPQH